MKYIHVAALMLLVGCSQLHDLHAQADSGVVHQDEAELKSKLQLAVNDLSHSIVHEDVKLFRRRFLPYKRHDERSGEEDRFIATQREGFIAHHGFNPPRVLDVRDEGDNRYSVSIWAEKFDAPSPKRLYFWRDPEDGELYWEGIHFTGIDAEVEKPGVLQQSLNWGACAKNINWDVQNPSGNPLENIRATWATGYNGYIPGCGPGDVCWSNSTMSPISNCNFQFSQAFGSTCTSNYLNVKQFSSPFSSTNGFDSRATTPPMTLNYALALMSPNDSSIRCGNAYIYSANNTCCWVNGWGWDFWWNSGNPTGSLPFCSVSWCPAN